MDESKTLAAWNRIFSSLRIKVFNTAWMYSSSRVIHCYILQNIHTNENTNRCLSVLMHSSQTCNSDYAWIPVVLHVPRGFCIIRFRAYELHNASKCLNNLFLRSSDNAVTINVSCMSRSSHQSPIITSIIIIEYLPVRATIMCWEGILQTVTKRSQLVCVFVESST